MLVAVSLPCVQPLEEDNIKKKKKKKKKKKNTKEKTCKKNTGRL